MYGGIYDPGIAPCPPRVSLALRIGVSTQCRALLTRGTTVFVPDLSDLYMYGMIHDPGMDFYPPRMTMAL